MRCALGVLFLGGLATVAWAGFVDISAFAGDTQDSFEGIAGPLAFPNFGVDGIRGPTPAGFTTATGLGIYSTGGTTYINDWFHGQANISSTGVQISSAGDVIDGTAYFFTYNTVGRVTVTLPHLASRWGAHMGGNGVQGTTFDMYDGPALVDSFTTVGLTDFTLFTGWQSAQQFDRIEWNGNHAGFDLFSYDDVSIPPPTYTITGPPGVATGETQLALDTMSPSSPTVDVQLHFSVDGGTTWTLCTAAASSAIPAVGSIPTGAASFTWDTQADGVGVSLLAPGVLVRATVNDGVSPGQGECFTAPFDVDNTALCQGICGDCDLNGAGPAILDALTAAQIGVALISPTLEQTGCCDVNLSGAIDVVDALQLAQSAAGLSVTLSCL